MAKDFSDMTLSELALARGTLQDYVNLAVVEARRTGSSWAAVGRQLGVSAQEAHRRYSWCEKMAGPGAGA
jgi:hypothetical protein